MWLTDKFKSMFSNGDSTMVAPVVPAPAPKTSPLAGWKTFLFNGGMAMAGVALTYFAQHGQEVIPASYWPIIATMIPLVNVWLRGQTSTPMFKSS
jgi:hypothetical protein